MKGGTSSRRATESVMSENEGGDSKFMSGFLVGFLVGVLICLGIGGSFIMVRTQREAVRVEEGIREAEMVAREAAEARAQAERERLRAEQLLKDAKGEKEK